MNPTETLIALTEIIEKQNDVIKAQELELQQFRAIENENKQEA